MAWQFERVAGPYQGPAGGVLWHEGGVLFSVVDEGLIHALRSADRRPSPSSVAIPIA